MNFSEENLRSTNCVLKNIAVKEPIAKALRMSDCWSAVKFKPLGPRYPKITGSQAPQINNSRTIMRKSLKRIALFIEGTNGRKRLRRLQALEQGMISWRRTYVRGYRG